MKVGIVGNGVVGKATSTLFKNKELFIYDIDPLKSYPSNIQIEDLKYVDIIFICVPTPSNSNGSCNIDIVTKVVTQLKYFCLDIPIVIRSTVPPGTCKQLDVFFMPEFLTEKNWKEDFRSCETWILGVNNNDILNTKFKTIIKTILDRAKDEGIIVSNRTLYMKTEEAELVKYVRNTFLAVKVSFFNEIYRFCEKREINYENVVSASILDSRIGSSHTKVPGPDGLFGYGGHCLVKDISALQFEFEKSSINSHILKASIQRNKIDRNDQ